MNVTRGRAWHQGTCVLRSVSTSLVAIAPPRWHAGEENAAMFNMACSWVRLGKPAAALSCVEALVDNNFEDFNAIRTDPDLGSLRGAELDKILAK